jgi:hypothetical protein
VAVQFEGADAAGGTTITVVPPPVGPEAPTAPVAPVVPVLPLSPVAPAGPGGPGTGAGAGTFTTVGGLQAPSATAAKRLDSKTNERFMADPLMWVTEISAPRPVAHRTQPA